MNALGSLLKPYVLFIAVAASALVAQSASAQRTRWEGRNGIGASTAIEQISIGVWSENAQGLRNAARFYYALHSTTPEYLMLHDARRDRWIAIHDAYMESWNAPAQRWEKIYDGRWIQPERVASRYSVQFTGMKIWDDKEGGSGDWRLNATVGTYAERTLFDKLEGGTGATLGFRSAPFIATGPTFDVSARVFEHDGGIGAKWEFVGHRQISVGAGGDYQLDFDNDEGRVTVYFRVNAL